MYDELLQQLIQLNFLPLGIVLFLAVFIVFNYPFEKKLSQQFTLPLILLVLLVIDDNIDYYLINSMDRSLFHVAVAVAGYNIRIVLMQSLVYIAARGSSRKEKILIAIPAAINFAITVMALFTRLVFWYGENGVTERGPLAYTPHIVSLIYAAVLFWYAYRVSLRGRTNESIIIVIAVILCLLGTYVEMTYRLRGILIGVIAMDATFYYLYIHIEHFKVDALTGALNRGSFYVDMVKLEQRKQSVHILSVDLNGLKQINDTYGHASGDEAIKYVADLIKKTIPSKARLYRIGGDEFVVLYPEYGIATSVISDLREKAEGGKYTYAVGECIWDGSIPFEKAYMEADREMYEYKRMQKSGKGE